jgi:hypothetical protein
MKTYRKKKKQIVEIEDVQEPFCGSRKKDMVPLCDADPDVAEEWLYAKNCGWGPEDFSKGSNVKAWWQCSYCLRDYKAQIYNRTGNLSACPYCASKRVCTDNSLEDLYPELSKEWHPTKNGKLKPSQVIKFSLKRAFWLCSKCSHEWDTTIAERTYLGSGCPECYRQRRQYSKEHHVKPPHVPIVLGETTDIPREWYENNEFESLADSHRKVAKQWHPTKNGEWTPKDFSRASGVIAWWKCKKGSDHEWQDTIAHRTCKGIKRGCPFCAGQRVSITNSLKTLFPKLAKEWHPKLNGNLTPADVTSGSDRKVWWKCKRFSDHDPWETSVYLRSKGSGCPQCSGNKASPQNCLQNEFPYLAAQLHPTKNGSLKGDQITAKSKKKVWWICSKGPDHEWPAKPCDRTLKGSGCPACYGRQLSITNCLKTVFPEISKLWDKKKNGKLRPQDVFPYSKINVWWICKDGHSWQNTVKKQTRSTAGCYECRTGRKHPSSETPAQVMENLKATVNQTNSPTAANRRRASDTSKSTK